MQSPQTLSPSVWPKLNGAPSCSPEFVAAKQSGKTWNESSPPCPHLPRCLLATQARSQHRAATSFTRSPPLPPSYFSSPGTSKPHVVLAYVGLAHPLFPRMEGHPVRKSISWDKGEELKELVNLRAFSQISKFCSVQKRMQRFGIIFSDFSNVPILFHDYKHFKNIFFIHCNTSLLWPQWTYILWHLFSTHLMSALAEHLTGCSALCDIIKGQLFQQQCLHLSQNYCRLVLHLE